MPWLYMALFAGLVRLDGWGPEAGAPKWQMAIAEFFGVWVNGVIAALLTWACFGYQPGALLVGLAFVAWRAPELGDYWGPDWHHWPEMFLRAAVPSGVAFTILSYIFYNHPYYGWLFVPMSIMQMLLYNGLQRFNRDVAPISWYHVIAEVGTGFAFSGCITLILSGV